MEQQSTAGGPVPAPEELLAIASEVARSAAELAQRMRSEAVTQVTTKSTATDPVTAADRAVERAVTAELRRRRPADAVLGEEYGVVGDAGSGVRWVVDPIDGTVNYLYGIPWYAVSLAAEVAGRVVAGVVRNITTGAEWSAATGGGAYRDGTRLTGSRQQRLDRALVATGFGYEPARRAHQGRVVAALLPEVRDLRRLGSGALDLCQAAEGTVDAYFEKGLSPWDLAAGGLIATEAGLRVDGLAGAPAGKAMVIAAPPGLFDALHDRLVALDASGGP